MVNFSENFVRLYWKSPIEGYKDNDSYAPDLYLLDLGKKHFFDANRNLLWEEAADYTRLILKQIEELEEQLDWLAHFTKDVTNGEVQKKARINLIEETWFRLDALKKDLTM
jgi:hypothetical protein